MRPPAARGAVAARQPPARHGPLATTLARAVRERRTAIEGLNTARGPLLQRHTGAETAEELLNRTREGDAPTYARRLCDGPELPQGLVELRDTIAQSTGKVIDVVRSELANRLVPRAQLLRPDGLHEKFESNLRDWASGSGGKAFDINIPGINHFMAGLFELIVEHVPDTEINEFDLFHGHVVPTEKPRDLVILFHAKEYPARQAGLFPLLSPETIKQATASGVIRNEQSFGDDLKTMTDRNFLWVLSTNTLWALSDPERVGEKKDVDFATLLGVLGIEDPELAALEEYQRTVGTVSEGNFGTDLMNVNYFPQHIPGGAREALFFTPILNLDAELAHRAATTWQDRQPRESLLRYIWQVVLRMGD